MNEAPKRKVRRIFDVLIGLLNSEYYCRYFRVMRGLSEMRNGWYGTAGKREFQDRKNATQDARDPASFFVRQKNGKDDLPVRSLVIRRLFLG